MRDEKKDDSRQPNRDSTWAWHKTIWKTVGWLLGESVIQAIEQAAKRHIGVIRWIGGLGGIAVGLGFLAGGLGPIGLSLIFLGTAVLLIELEQDH